MKEQKEREELKAIMSKTENQKLKKSIQEKMESKNKDIKK